MSAVAPLDDVPVLLLARLAVHRELQGHGVGKALLKHVLATTKRVADVVGVRALLVDAIDARAEAFYMKYGCKPFPTATGYPRRLYLLANVIP